jgi:hypothetical protein
MRINVTIPDDLKHLADLRAKSLGLSLSAFVRLTLAKETGRLNKIDQRILEIEEDGFEKVEYESLKKDLKRMIKNAKD